jgi:hypothetical protein
MCAGGQHLRSLAGRLCSQSRNLVSDFVLLQLTGVDATAGGVVL